MNEAHDGRAPRTLFLALATLIGLWLLWDSAVYRLVTYSLWADYWEHSAALTEWLRNLASPGNPHVADGSSSARYIPPYLLMVLIGKPLGLDAIDLMALSAVVNYGLVVGGIWLFCNLYFRHAWAPAVMLVVLFAGWGVPWIWSNLYELRSFFMTASYPSTFVFGLSLISFGLTLSFMRGSTGAFSSLAGLLIMSALGFISHALTGVFLIGASCLLAVTEPAIPLSRRAAVIITMAGSLVLATLWPYFPLWEVLLASSNEVDDRTWQGFSGFGAMLERARSGAWWHMFFQPDDLAVSLGPALLGVPLALWLLVRRRYLFIPLGLFMMSAPLVLNVFFQIALAHRFLLYAIFFMHLAMVWGALSVIDQYARQRGQHRLTPATQLGTGLLILTMGVASIGHVALLVGDYRGVHLKQTLELVDKRAALPEGYDAPRLYTELTAAIPEDAVVIGNSRLTWPLPTFRGKAVALPPNHANSLLTDQFERSDAVDLFLSSDASAEQRSAIIDRYAVTHVLVNYRKTDPAVMLWLDDNATELTTVERYRMYSLN